MIFFSEEYIVGMVMGSVIFWAVVPSQLRIPFIALTSTLSVGLIQPVFTGILIVLIAFVYFGTVQIQKGGKLAWVFSIILVIAATLLLGKYMLVYFAPIASAGGFEQNYIIPLGISYLTIKMIDFVISVKQGSIKQINFTSFLAYITFLPTFSAGPIERYAKFTEDAKQAFIVKRYFPGFQRIIIGFFKKVVLVDGILDSLLLGKVKPYIVAHAVWKDVPPEAAFAFIFLSLLYAYLDLSAYADIAIGLGQLYGFQTCENMDYPLSSQNISEFWKRWHISLSMWCRNNVYFPILGLTRSNTMGIYAAFVIMGLWHFVSIKFIIWGLWQATGIVIYSWWTKNIKKRLAKTLSVPPLAGKMMGISLTVTFAAFGYSFMMADSLDQAFQILRGALFLNRPLFDMVL